MPDRDGESIEFLLKAMSAVAQEQRDRKERRTQKSEPKAQPDEEYKASPIGDRKKDQDLKDMFAAALRRETERVKAEDPDDVFVFTDPDSELAAPSRTRRRPQVLRFDGKTMPWGKHIGEPIKDVPITYIAWLMDRQMTGESAVTDALAEKLLESFMLQIMVVPVYKRVMLSLADKAKAGTPPAPRRAIATTEEGDPL